MCTSRATSASAKSIFLQAVELPAADERQAYLDAQCGPDADLRREVDDLLKYQGEVGSFLESPPTAVAASAAQLRANVPQSPTLGFLQPSSRADSLGRLGRHEVLEVVGSGGMGVVLKAFDEQLQRVVAIKALADSLASNEHARRRFIREGRAAAAIRDDHVIGIYGVDESNGLPFLVMEFIVGRSLAQRLEAEGPLPLAEILRIGAQIARGLAAAHSQGVVHRDIKPANILLENGVERVKITDFGLAHAVDDVRTTQPGTVVGTPEYMSPEQARGERVDHRSDLFSLGCVLYAMCAGRPPFRAESTVAIIRRVCDDTPRPLAEINSEIPEWLVDLIDKLIAKSATERFQSAAEVAELLSQYLAHVQQPAINPQPAHHRRIGVSPVRTSRRWSIAAAAAFLLCAGLTLAESTGVTNVAATVIRIVRGDGTLVVEVDDPNIQVLVDGEELVINGAGPKEIRLRPGEHELKSVKDGKPIDTKLVTITREGREVVKVTREVPLQAKTGPMTRLVWGDKADTDGALSPDGRYLALIDWDTSNLAVRELATGSTRPVSNIRALGHALDPHFSPDGAQLAFTWNYPREGDPPNSAMLNDLRVVSLTGGEPRVVFLDRNTRYVTACGWSPDGTWILADLSSKGEGSQLARIVLADGTVQIVRQLGDWRKFKIGSVRLSPDGKTIAYARLAEPAAENRDIFFIDAQSGQEKRVTSHAADKQLLGWTPSGHLLFDMERQGSRDAWLLHVVAGEPQGEPRIVKKDLGTISPLGISTAGTLYYASSSRGPGLFLGTLDMERASMTVAPLAAEQFNISDTLLLNDWSPDGEHLSYTARVPGTPQRVEMRILSMKSGQKRVLELNDNGWVNRNRWSPDGRAFLAISPWVEGGPGTVLIDALSGKASTVIEGAARAVWARDGRGIFYSYGRRPIDGERRIVYRDLETQTERNIIAPGFTDRRSPFEPSPDGRQLALVNRDNSLTIWLIPLDGGAPRELFKGSSPESSADAYDRVIAWTRDGKHLIFKRGGDKSSRGLWYISTEGGAPQQMAVSGLGPKNVSVVAIHPDGKQVALSVSGGNQKSDIWALENFLPPLADSKPLAAADVSAATGP